MTLKLSSFLLILSLGVSLVYAATTDEKKAAEYSQRGAAYFSKGNYWMAIDEFKKSIELLPSHYKSHSNLGYAYLYANKPDEALECFKKALSLNPDCLEAMRGIGTAYLNLGKYNEAASYLEKSISMEPNTIPPYMALGDIYSKQGRHKDSIPLYEKVIANNPSFLRAYTQIAFSYSMIGDFENGYKYMKKAQGLSPNDKTIREVVIGFENKLKNEQNAKETIWKNSIFQEPKGKTMDLVNFTPVKINLPFNIKYPANWYVREEVADMSMVCISREPIKEMNDKYYVGFSGMYQPNYFISREPAYTALGKTAKAVVKTVDWDKDKARFVDSLKQNGYDILSQSEVTLSNQPALKIEYTSSVVKVKMLYINLGTGLLTLLFEAPPAEYNQYSEIFEQMIKSASIRNDFKITSVTEALAKITQEQINTR